MSQDSLEAIAYHESGHAVTSTRLGLRFQAVDITPSDRGTSGGMRVWTDAERPPLDQIAVLIAGPVAQAKYSGLSEAELRELLLPVDLQLDHGGANDLFNARDLAGDIAAAKLGLASSHPDVRLRRRELVEEQRSRVVDLLFGDDALWRAVQSVAAALLEHETLTGDEVLRLLSLAEELEG